MGQREGFHIPHIYFETDRLTVRQWTIDDAKALYSIMSDSSVHTYTGDTPWSSKRAKDYIKFMLKKNFQTLELFHGACILKSTNELIGLAGLNPYLPKQPELEWQLGAPFWGRGYATEIGRVVIREAFRTTDISCIHGMANPENIASMKALEKSGMICVGLQEFHGHMVMFYRIERESVL